MDISMSRTMPWQDNQCMLIRRNTKHDFHSDWYSYSLIAHATEYKLMQAALFPRKVVQQHMLIGPINNDTESAFIGTIFFIFDRWQ